MRERSPAALARKFEHAAVFYRNTDEYLDAVLAKFLHHRMAMFKSSAKAKV